MLHFASFRTNISADTFARGQGLLQLECLELSGMSVPPTISSITTTMLTTTTNKGLKPTAMFARTIANDVALLFVGRDLC